MSSHERYRRMDAARVRAELSVQDLWLRYVALSGTGDAFDLDGYLQGLAPLETFQQDVLAQALNEALEDSYQAYLVPLSAPPTGVALDAGLLGLIDALLDDHPPAGTENGEPPGPSSARPPKPRHS
jgi:hypothetical protein